MHEIKFSPDDLAEMKHRGITPAQVKSQLEAFRRGIPAVHLLKPCVLGDGVKRLSAAEIQKFTKVFERARKRGRCLKFVPASGAASRMFKFLQSVGDHYEKLDLATLKRLEHKDSDHRDFLRFVREIRLFAFYEELKCILKSHGHDLHELIRHGDLKILLTALLSDLGLGYASRPKGLVLFHQYGHHARSPFEEHLSEAAHYGTDQKKRARIHFTVPPGMEASIRKHLSKMLNAYQEKGIHISLGFSIQKPSTDTAAAGHDNHPFRDSRGKMVFRPGGHGALLENLNALHADIIFIKNIDNVVPDYRKKETYRYKRALAGLLLDLETKIHGVLKKIKRKKLNAKEIPKLMKWMQRDLQMMIPEDIVHGSEKEQVQFIFESLNRPIRICGMVRNEGERGGGPFWVKVSKEMISKQIVESSQIDMNIPEQRRLWNASHYFNPVDLVCGVRDYLGQPFNLKKFTDPETGFISKKFQDGKELKALEHPGLWNGSMARWITLFVEVPMSTFSPVKTVMDLLRAEHQPSQS